MNEKIHAHFKHVGGYKFNVTFDELPKMIFPTDEPLPVGGSEGASASMLLSSSVGHCLSSSLLYCLEKSRVKAKDLSTDVEIALARNEKGRWRVSQIKVNLRPKVDEKDREKLERCKGIFEDFCTVTASVRKGIEIDVEVKKD